MAAIHFVDTGADVERQGGDSNGLVGGPSSLASTLRETLSNRSQAGEPGPEVLQQWRAIYNLMVQEALALGIPRSAIPVLRQEATAQELRAAREHLDGMVQSFLSASL